MTKDFFYVAVKAVNGEPAGSAHLAIDMQGNNQNTIQYTGSSRNNLLASNDALYNPGNPNEMIE